MTKEELFQLILLKRSYLCVGLDPDLDRIPAHLHKTDNPVLNFNRAIIQQTHPYCVAYKPNLAFYESLGRTGWSTLEATIDMIPPGILKIADAKRGDISNTAKRYAKAFFEELDFDAITLSPYMGMDAIEPFLHYPGKWLIVLIHTSNAGSADFQELDTGGRMLYERVLERCMQLGSSSNMMFVVGATYPETLRAIRQAAPEHFFLVPGIGAQGGSLREISAAAMNAQCGLLCNVSRSILYAGGDEDFDRAAGRASRAYQSEMQGYLEQALNPQHS